MVVTRRLFIFPVPPEHSVPSWLVGIPITSRHAPEINILVAARCLPQHSAPPGHLAPSKLIGTLLAAWRSTGHSRSSRPFGILPDAWHPPGHLVPSCNSTVTRMALSSQETLKDQEWVKQPGAPNGWEYIEWPGVRWAAKGLLRPGCRNQSKAFTSVNLSIFTITKKVRQV